MERLAPAELACVESAELLQRSDARESASMLLRVVQREAGHEPIKQGLRVHGRPVQESVVKLRDAQHLLEAGE
ncbi:MAG: hypothetical protein O2819_04380 [Planctomycetota bacterium]|nr:hypothetical protein [Planctomycetota bacterium]